MNLTKRTIARVAVAVLLIAVIAPFAVFTVPQVVGADHSYVVISGSMTPAIGVNDAVIVNSVSPSSIHDGDVIAFHENGQFGPNGEKTNVVTHRVVKITKTNGRVAFETKGDANDEPDPWTVPSSALIGRVAFTIPLIGYVIGFASSQMGFVALVAVPLGLLVLGELYDLARAARNTRAERDDEKRAETDGGTDAERDGTDEPIDPHDWQWGDE